MAKPITKKAMFSDDQVEKEIARLLESDYVKLAKKDEAIRNRRRQYMYNLRSYEKKGKELAEKGITIALLEKLDRECDVD